MATVVHISDLHFGRTDPGLVEPLIEAIREVHPHILVVSGDLTQRARPEEFAQARQFLDRLPFTKIVVPGNHDIPLHNLFARFFQPLTRFRHQIARDLHPFFESDEVAILGLNTARSFTTKRGRISLVQMAEIRRRLCAVKAETIKAVVTHHPFDLPPDAKPRELVGRAEEAMAPLSECKVDLLLAGHMHLSLSGRTAQRYKIAGYSAIFVQAGTAISTRGRGEPNSFNVLQIETSRIRIKRHSWEAEHGGFKAMTCEEFHRAPHGWDRAGDGTGVSKP